MTRLRRDEFPFPITSRAHGLRRPRWKRLPFGRKILGGCASLHNRRRLRKFHDVDRIKAAYRDVTIDWWKIKRKYGPDYFFHVNQTLNQIDWWFREITLLPEIEYTPAISLLADDHFGCRIWDA